MAQCCNPLTLQPEQSGERGSNPTSIYERHDKGSRTRLALNYAIPAFGAENHNFTFTYCSLIVSDFIRELDPIILQSRPKFPDRICYQFSLTTLKTIRKTAKTGFPAVKQDIFFKNL